MKDRNDVLRRISASKEKLKPKLGEYQTLVDGAKNEKGEARAFTAEETEKHVRMGAEIQALNVEIQADEAALRGIDLCNAADDRTADDLRLSGREKLPQASEAYLEAFCNAARGGFSKEAIAVAFDGQEFKNLSTVAPSTGGVLIPTVIESGIMMEALSLSPLLAISRVITTTSTKTQIPFGARIGVMGPRKEAEAYVLTDPALSNKSIDIFNYGAFFPISQELEDDTDALAAYFTTIFGEAYAETAEEYGWKGTGGQTSFTALSGSGTTVTLAGRVCPGIRTENSTAVPVVTALDDTALAVDDIIKLKQAVNARYRNSGVYVISGDAETKLLLLKDTTGRPIWQPSLVVGQPSMLNGSAYYVSDRLAAVAAEANVGFFGDFKRGHEIRIRKGLSVKRSEHFLFGNGQIAMAADVRMGSKVKLNAAIARLNMDAAPAG
jgi:HK97 family phage major capsid protein